MTQENKAEAFKKMSEAELREYALEQAVAMEEGPDNSSPYPGDTPKNADFLFDVLRKLQRDAKGN